MNTLDRVLGLNDPGHAKAMELDTLEKELNVWHRLKIDALVKGSQHTARFYEGLYLSASDKYMKLKEV